MTGPRCPGSGGVMRRPAWTHKHSLGVSMLTMVLPPESQHCEYCGRTVQFQRETWRTTGNFYEGRVANHRLTPEEAAS